MHGRPFPPALVPAFAFLFAAVCPAQAPACRVSLRLLDEQGKSVHGLVRVVSDPDGKPVEIAGPMPRGFGLPVRAGKQPSTPEEKQKAAAEVGSIREWYVVAGTAEFHLPRGKYKAAAFRGLDTEFSSAAWDLTARDAFAAEIKLRRFSRPAEGGWFAGNTHLHLARVSKAESDQYLTEIPPAEGLDLLFISYLLRPSEDAHYVTNGYPLGDLKAFWSRGVLVNNGQEQRNNFSPFDEGFGHVMMLDIRKPVEPVSIGPGITGKGHDFPPLAAGLDEARKQGGKIIWCHNTFGVERLPSLITGRVDAQNIHDGGEHGSISDGFYALLNSGFRVPFSTGTDWFMYDFNRVYVKVNGAPSIRTWLEGLTAGRTFITNSALLTLKVDGKDIGDTVTLDKPGPVTIEAEAVGRQNFGRLEIVLNGRPVSAVPAVKAKTGIYRSKFSQTFELIEPGWIAARITTDARNEYGRSMFAHTSPVYVTVGGKRVLVRADAQALVKQLEAARAKVTEKGRFADAAQKAKVLEVYDEAIAVMKKKLGM